MKHSFVTWPMWIKRCKVKVQKHRKTAKTPKMLPRIANGTNNGKYVKEYATIKKNQLQDVTW